MTRSKCHGAIAFEVVERDHHITLRVERAISREVDVAHVDRKAVSRFVLDLPGRDASFEERAAAYERLRPLRSLRHTINGNDHNHENYLELADRRRVYRPEDLIAAVEPNSETARAVRVFESYQVKANWYGGTALLFALAGGTLLALSAAGGGPPDTKLFGAGLVVGGAGTLTFGVVSQRFRNRATDQQFRAFDSYDGDLQRRLSLCVPPACGGQTILDAPQAMRDRSIDGRMLARRYRHKVARAPSTRGQAVQTPSGNVARGWRARQSSLSAVLVPDAPW